MPCGGESGQRCARISVLPLRAGDGTSPQWLHLPAHRCAPFCAPSARCLRGTTRAEVEHAPATADKPGGSAASGTIARRNPAAAGVERDRGRLDPALHRGHVLRPLCPLPQSVHRRSGVRAGALGARGIFPLHSRARRARPPARAAELAAVCIGGRRHGAAARADLEHSRQVRPTGVVLSEGTHPALRLHLHFPSGAALRSTVRPARRRGGGVRVAADGVLRHAHGGGRSDDHPRLRGVHDVEQHPAGSGVRQGHLDTDRHRDSCRRHHPARAVCSFNRWWRAPRRPICHASCRARWRLSSRPPRRGSKQARAMFARPRFSSATSRGSPR